MSILLAAALLAKAPEREWTVVYYMSYDNNLERCGPVILDGLEKGVKDPAIAVTVLHDDRRRDGLNRHVLTAAGRATEKLATDDSASEETLREYLSWAARTHPAKRLAVVFLDHGGKLDEMCADEWPKEGGTKHWLSAKLVGPILRDFAKSANVELLFLQQCGRGSIDNLYAFRGAAATVMASQTTVGAPNTYYEKSMKWLAANPKATGAELAKRIAGDDEHFTNYAWVDGKALAELPGRLAPAVKALDKAALPTGLKPCFPCDGEANYDLVAWLEAACGDASKEFTSWIREKLVVGHGKRGRAAADWCGLSIFVPKSRKQFDRYADHPLYADSALDDVWKAKLGDDK